MARLFQPREEPLQLYREFHIPETISEGVADE
jgi:hypothetical protein